jgi:N-acetylglucosamine malate deacetylase 1
LLKELDDARVRITMKMNMQRILVLAPHTDDAELGCGGTIARFVEEGRKVFVAAFSTAEESLPSGMSPDTLKREFLEAMPLLGVPVPQLTVFDFQVRRLGYHRQDVLEKIVVLRREIAPDLVLLPSGHDLHQDHQVVFAEGLRAFKDMSVMGYELPWNHIDFSAQAFFALERRHIEKKWTALKSYRSQLDLERLYFKQEFIEGIARVRGAQVRAEWAEAFEVLRLRW